LGRPFDDTAYRAAQAAEAARPRLPYHAFVRAVTLWDGSEPAGTGWVSGETNATILRDEPDAAGKRPIHYRVRLNNYRYAAFGWRWAAPPAKPLDLRNYDAISFAIRVTGPKPPEQLFFSVDEMQPAPLSLREYEPDVLDGNWHRITIPVWAMKWTGASATVNQVSSFAFQTFVWDPAEYEIQLDDFAAERLANPAAAAMLKPSREPERSAGKPQVIPGRIQCAFYDLGGEGVAYHDTTPLNILSGVLNQQPRHQRPHATAYEWNFRREEGVDISFTKDWADLNHTNLFEIGPNQLYLGGTEEGEWCRYTVMVKKAGTYRILAAYGNDAHGQSLGLALNHQPVQVFPVPVVTGSMHKWNRRQLGTMEFPQAGPQLLTLYYGRGFNLAYFEFLPQP